MLDLVDDCRAAELRKEISRIGFGEVPHVRRLQVGILQIREGGPAKGRLARLPRSGNGDEGILPEQRPQARRDLALDHAGT